MSSRSRFSPERRERSRKQKRSSRSRSPMEPRRQRSRTSSPQPPPPIHDQAALKKFQVILKNGGPAGPPEGNIFCGAGSASEPLEVGLRSALGDGSGGGNSGSGRKSGYGGPDGQLPPKQDLREIQIEIHRSIRPGLKISTSPIRRSIRTPDTVVITRRPGEGTAPIFDDLLRAQKDSPVEERRIVLARDSGRPPLRVAERPRNWREGSWPPDEDASGFVGGGGGQSRSGDDRTAKKLKDRLGGDSFAAASAPVKNRLGQRGEEEHRSRWQAAEGDNDHWGHRRRPQRTYEDSHVPEDSHVLSREELDSRRPAAGRPWELDPESVPRSSYYFEHDDREYRGGLDHRNFRPQWRGRGSSFYSSRGPSNGWHRGGWKRFEPRGRPGGFEADFGPPAIRHRKRPYSPGCWKHDLYEDRGGEAPT